MAIDDNLPKLPVVDPDTVETILEATIYCPRGEGEYLQEMSDQIKDENFLLYAILSENITSTYNAAKMHGASEEVLFDITKAMIKSYVLTYGALDNQLEADSKGILNLPVVNPDTVETLIEATLAYPEGISDFFRQVSAQIKDENPLLYELLSENRIQAYNSAKMHGASEKLLFKIVEGTMISYILAYSALENQLQADYMNDLYNLHSLGNDLDSD